MPFDVGFYRFDSSGGRIRPVRCRSRRFDGTFDCPFRSLHFQARRTMKFSLKTMLISISPSGPSSA